MRHDCGLRVLGKLELVVRPLAPQPEQILAERLVDLVEHVLRAPARPGQRGAHPDRLAALPRKNECAHRDPCYEPSGRLGRRAAIAKARGERMKEHRQAKLLGPWM